MSEVSITLPDGSSRRVPAGSTPADVAAAISPRLAKAAIAALVDGRPTDLTFPLPDGARVEILTDRGHDALHVYRHSTAHLLA
ncbi:MAG TPA: TGS domain-containing protein, partial [Vicinamibacterales bacterium]